MPCESVKSPQNLTIQHFSLHHRSAQARRRPPERTDCTGRDGRLCTGPEDRCGLLGGRGKLWRREEKDGTSQFRFNSSTGFLYAWWRVTVVSNPLAGRSGESPLQAETKRGRVSLFGQG